MAHTPLSHTSCGAVVGSPAAALETMAFVQPDGVITCALPWNPTDPHTHERVMVMGGPEITQRTDTPGMVAFSLTIPRGAQRLAFGHPHPDGTGRVVFLGHYVRVRLSQSPVPGFFWTAAFESEIADVAGLVLACAAASEC